MPPAPDVPPLVSLRDVARVYPRGAGAVVALAGVSLDVRDGEKLAIMGPSGSGKTTLMNVIGCLDRPTAGSYKLDGVEVLTYLHEHQKHMLDRVIVCTVDPETVASYPCAAVITKPIDRSHFVRFVRNCIEKSPGAAPV